MKIIVDSNKLQTEQLRDFLAGSIKNYAVLPDFVAMEAYKGDPLKSIFKSMSILSGYPSQVIVLKGSRKIFGLSGRVKGLQRRMIDEKQTAGFNCYVQALKLAQTGDVGLRCQINKLGVDANTHLGSMLNDAEQIREAVKVFGSELTKAESASLRAGEYTSVLIDKVVRSVLDIVNLIFLSSPLVSKVPIYSELSNTFIFRVTLACYLLGLRRFVQGGFDGLSSEKFRNDFVDMALVAYGTYFDGIMSADKNVNYMFGEICSLLVGLFDAEVPALSRIK
ncbi:hypothetical protein OP492_24420 [Pseudomonas mosselii]|uniref:hypothetical protein n=1 Tax=Pseudomonas mosselii TaxID=78327 RepID=UPI0021A30D05|nr:hypothetical protein [Pseudomonas mosselii]MEA3237804.1 hypothetical protein [Pseudomonas mosselii]UWS66487.1 hypothetical protein N0U38_22410 [Pseudomonas mosselii]